MKNKTYSGSLKFEIKIDKYAVNNYKRRTPFNGMILDNSHFSIRQIYSAIILNCAALNNDEIFIFFIVDPYLNFEPVDFYGTCK
jgi:hypothetical protein